MIEKSEARKALECYCYDMRHNISNNEALTQQEKNYINKEIDDTYLWIESQQEISEIEYEKKKKELENKIQSILQNKKNKNPKSDQNKDYFDSIDERLNKLCETGLYEKFEPTVFDF